MSKDVKVSVVIPTMNEEESIGVVMDAIHEAMKGKFKKTEYEIVVVDTNSKDKTIPIATEKGARIIDEPRRGYGRAYKTGFAEAYGDYIATLDADCTYPAEDIPKLVAMLEKDNLDFITCDRLSKLKPGVMSATHRFGNWALKTAMNVLFGMHLKDSQTGMWVFRKAILEKLELTSDGMPLSEEIKIEAHRKKVRMREVPIRYSIRQGEVKLNTMGDGWKNMKFFFVKRMGKATPDS